jgi:hypothetical protein
MPNGLTHRTTYGPWHDAGRAITIHVPRPQNADGTLREPLYIIVPNVPRLTDQRRLSLMRAALRAAGWTELADTAPDGKVLGEAYKRMIPYTGTRYRYFDQNGRAAVDYQADGMGGWRWAEDFGVLS